MMLTGILQLNDNNFSGTIPSTLGSLVSLEHILFDNNALVGPIPTELAQCQNLKTLSLGVNQLTGDIGPVINMLPPSLAELGLAFNLFNGTIPTSIGTFTDLNWLGLSENNLIGTIPSELGLLSNLTTLFLHENQFTGTVPASLANLPLRKSTQSLVSIPILPTFCSCAHFLLITQRL
jgi:Leucine-rich repeat (LRR) protein